MLHAKGLHKKVEISMNHVQAYEVELEEKSVSHVEQKYIELGKVKVLVQWKPSAKDTRMHVDVLNEAEMKIFLSNVCMRYASFRQ